jgi:small subunit ribosomal protein S8
MVVTDPIGDFLTRIRNAQMAGHRMVEIPSSNMKKRLTEILYEQGYILKYRFVEDGYKSTIQIAIKYDPETKQPVIKSLGRISRPGLRKYSGANEIPRIINGLGVCVVSTSNGMMTDKEARRQNVGGELLCYIY